MTHHLPALFGENLVSDTVLEASKHIGCFLDLSIAPFLICKLFVVLQCCEIGRMGCLLCVGCPDLTVHN